MTPDEPDGIFHEDGWARVTVWGGEDYDLCPDCVRKALGAVGIEEARDDR